MGKTVAVNDFVFCGAFEHGHMMADAFVVGKNFF